MYSNLPIFSGLSEKQISESLKSLNSKEIVFDPGSYIVKEGQKVTNIGIIVSGLAQVEKTDWNGNRNILFEVPSNSLFGEALFCTGVDVFHLTITAKERTTVIFIEGKILLDDISVPNRTVILSNLMTIMANKNLVFREKLDILSRRSTREKLLQYLTFQAEHAKKKSFDINLDRQSLADYLGVERSALSEVISQLRNQGVITCRKNHFELL